MNPKPALIFVMALAGCAAEKAVAAEATYEGQLLSCVERSATLAESRACRADVDARWSLKRRETP
jgi:hypothetical protein